MFAGISEAIDSIEKMLQYDPRIDPRSYQALLLWRAFSEIGSVLCIGCDEYTNLPYSISARELEDRWFIFMLCYSCFLDMNIAARNNFNANICVRIDKFLEWVEYSNTPDFLYLFKDQERANIRRFMI